MNSTSDQVVAMKLPHEHLSDNNTFKEKENLAVTKTDDEIASPLTNGKGTNEVESVNVEAGMKVEDISKDDVGKNNEIKQGDVNGKLDAGSIDLVDEDAVLINDFEEGADEPKTLRIERQLNKIELLKENLRCEEATLNILRKLIDSQHSKNGLKPTVKQTAPQVQQTKQPPQQSQQQQQQQQQQTAKTGPPPKQYQKVSSQQPASNPPSEQKYYIQVGNQLVPAPPPSTAGSGGGTVYQYANGHTTNRHAIYQQQPSKPTPPKQTAEQKQNAAKAALRRQLEQTLLQIPPPRPPPADWKAIPNVNSMDFMMLVGLDEVVDTILDSDSRPTLRKYLADLTPYNPRICAQCGVDFSLCWKKADGSDEFVLCERCASQNVKKDLKAEHTSRLKSVFLKALKQEQEIEEKIKNGEDINVSNISGGTNDKSENSSLSVNSQSTGRNSSPKSPITVPSQSRNHSGRAERSERAESSDGHHHHGRPVVQHYPHHSPLVQQLHHQHMQQEPQSQHRNHHTSSRSHPYRAPSSANHHHREHHREHHRSSGAGSESVPPPPHQEYYVVHHPQHAGNVRYINR